MIETNTYKPSNKFSPIGIILMFFSMLAVGLILSWLYLILNRAIPLIYLNIILAAGVSFGLGAIGGFFVKVYKIRAPKLALIVSIIALIFVNYGKWAIYVGRDYDKYMYDDMRDSQVTELYTMIVGKNVPLPSNEEEAKELLTAMELSKNYNIKNELTKMVGGNSDLEKQLSAITMLTNVLGETVGDMLENLLGSTPEEIVKCAEKIKNSGSMNLYEYLYDFRGLQPRTATWLMVHPGELFSDIKNINTAGRWTIKSHRYGLGDNQGDNVSGILLWMVWFGELAMLTIPALLMIHKKAKYPFIESEDEWAVEDKPTPTFLFADLFPSEGADSTMVKGRIMRDPDYLLSMPIITVTQAIPEKYYSLTYCRSKYYDEIYITVQFTTVTNPRKNQKKTTPVVTYLRVTPDFLATLYGLFGYTVPPLCQGVNKAEEVKKENQERANNAASGRPHAPTPPKATGAEAIFDQPLYHRPAQQAAPKQEESFAEKELKEERKSSTTSGDMDGIDTSSLNLDDIDLNHM